MKAVFIFVLLFVSTAQVFAFEDCGVFEFEGRARQLDGKYVLVLHEGSRSEVQLTPDADLEQVFGYYKNKYLKVKAQLIKPIQKYRGEIFTTRTEKERSPESNRLLVQRISREDIVPTMPRGLKPEEGEPKLIQKIDCK